MSRKYNTYKFEDFTLDIDEAKLWGNNIQIPLEPKSFAVLFFFVRNAGKVVTIDEILSSVWKETIVEESNVTTRISIIRKTLGQNNSNVFIETGKNKKSYKFVKRVEAGYIPKPSFVDEKTEYRFIEPGNAPDSQPSAVPDDFESDQEPAASPPSERLNIYFIAGSAAAILLIYAGLRFNDLQNCESQCFEINIYVYLASVCYGILFGIGLVLESAYRFDEYGWNAAKMAVPVGLVNFGAISCALFAANYYFSTDLGYSLSAGAGFLFLGAVISAFLGQAVLPNHPLTAARYQTQPAFPAFLKNAFIYFLPLYAIFSLLIFCLNFSPLLQTNSVAYPATFFVLWLVFFVFSYISTNYLSDNLLSGKDGDEYKYHHLFFSLLLFRMFFCFAPTLTFVGWYFARFM